MSTRVTENPADFRCSTIPFTAMMEPPSFASIFGDGMVLQRGLPLRIWGNAPPSSLLSLRLGALQVKVESGPDGRWDVELPATNEPGELTLEIQGETGNAVCRDILMGEVWLLAGQSNIEWESSKFPDSTAEAACRNLPEVRHFTVRPRRSLFPIPEVEGNWRPMTPESALGFSALGMTFASELHLELGVPVGVICCTLGDTCAEMWTSREALLASALFRDRVPPLPEGDRALPERYAPTCLFHGMVQPLAPIRTRGIVWYQGESNGRRPHEYRELFSRLIHDWRRLFQTPELPFHYVQLPRFRAFDATASTGDWAELRRAQAEILLDVPHTAMVPAIDLGDAEDIHPRGKGVIAYRLVSSVLSRVYSRKAQEDAPEATPLCWRERGVELVLSGPAHLKEPGGFLLQDESGAFHPALGRLTERLLQVYNPAVRNPQAVRYAWADHPPVTFFGASGWPVPPFDFRRT